MLPFSIADFANASVSPQTYFTSTPGNFLSMLKSLPNPAVCEFSAPIIPIRIGFSAKTEEARIFG
jgi:hypothetical protein